MTGADHADRYNVLRGDNDSIGRHRHYGIEVVRRQRGGEIAELVGENA
jgi:hypothetical protein